MPLLLSRTHYSLLTAPASPQELCEEAVRLGLTVQGLEAAARDMPCTRFLVEEMITGALAELLIGVMRDPAHGYVLTIAAGGVLTEILKDSVSLLLPTTPADVDAALDRLKIAPLLNGFRGKPPCNRAAILRAVMAVQDYVLAHASGLQEIEINPLICTADDAIAADALMRRKDWMR